MLHPMFLLLAGFLLVGQGAQGSPYTGNVVDLRTDQPLAGVKITVPEDGIETITDTQGDFTLPKEIPPYRILLAELAGYLPLSVITAPENPQIRLRLELQTPGMRVLEAGIQRLGDNKMTPQSSSGGFTSQATAKYKIYTFELTDLGEDYWIHYLRIDAVVGVDTPDSVAAKESQLPVSNTFTSAETSGLQIFLNDTLIKRITRNAKEMTLMLPSDLLKVGTNELHIVTGNDAVQLSRSPGLLGITQPYSIIVGDFDDVAYGPMILFIPGQKSPPITVP